MIKLRTQQAPYILSSIGIFLLSMVVYMDTLNNDFLFDDYDTIVNNAMVRESKYLPYLFKTDYFSLFSEISYRPVVTLTYFFDYFVYGLKSWGFHFTNIILHALNGVLLYIFLILFFRNSEVRSHKSEEAIKIGSFITYPPLLISVLFVIHPVLTEAVNAVSFREDLLAFLFYLITLICYLRLRTTENYLSIIYLLSCLAYFLALFSKEMAVTLPLIIYGYEWFFQEKDKRFYSVLLNPLLIGYVFVTLIYLYIRFFYLYNPNVGAIAAWSFAERLFTIPYLLSSHIRLSIWPVNLSADYSIVSVKSLLSLSFIFPFFICLSLLIAAIKLRKTEKHISFGIFFFFITLMPVYNIIPNAIPLAERYLYLPLLGFAIVLGMIIYKAASCCLRREWVLLSLLIIVTSLYSAGTIKRNYIWRDGYSLWADTIEKSPNGYLPNSNMGVEYFKKNRFDKAVKHFDQAIKIKPDSAEAYYNLGLALAMQGRIEEAIIRLEDAIRLKPDYSEAHQNLAVALKLQGKIEKAFDHYDKAVKLKPDNVEALNNLSWLIVTHEKLRGENIIRAVQLAEQACRLTGNGNAVYLRTLAAAYAANGQFPKAVNTAVEGAAQAVAAGQMELANEIRNNLELYKTGRPLPPIG